MATSIGEIRRALTELRNLEECILEKIVWSNYGTSIDFHFNYIWDGSKVRPDILEAPHIVVIKAIMVQELHIINAISEAMRQNPGNINWGFSEVAQVSIHDHSPLVRRHSLEGGDYYHLIIEWECDRRIDVVAGDLRFLINAPN